MPPKGPGAVGKKIKFKAIVPQKFKSKGFFDLMREALLRIQADLIDDFALTTTTWNHQPVISTMRRFSELKTGGWSFVRVFTKDRVYVMLEVGTRSHTITRRNASALRYQMDFTPKTQVRWIGSRQGGKSGAWTNRISVQHPGHESRLFTVVMREKQQTLMVQRARWVMYKGAQLSGHAI